MVLHLLRGQRFIDVRISCENEGENLFTKCCNAGSMQRVDRLLMNNKSK